METVKARKDGQDVYLVMTDSGLYVGPRMWKRRLAHPTAKEGWMERERSEVARRMGLPLDAEAGDMMRAAIDGLVAMGAEIG